MTVSPQREAARRGLELHPEKCTGCMQCLMACSLRYEGVVNPLKARTKIIRRDIVTRLTLSPECTLCGACVPVCHYGARMLKQVA